jgi:DNA/RNA endonuclease G (NUC1)
MKKLFILMLIALVSYQAKAQLVVVKYPGYTSYWHSIVKIPDSVVYVVKPHAKAVDREADFHATGGRTNINRDYDNSGYDKGHLCDASDENGNKTDEYNSFDQVNIFPQKPHLNRVTWLALENYVRVLAKKYGSVRVRVSYHGICGVLQPDRVAIPCYCDKEIWYGTSGHEKYSMPNADTVSNHLFTFYKVKP